MIGIGRIHDTGHHHRTDGNSRRWVTFDLWQNPILWQDFLGLKHRLHRQLHRLLIENASNFITKVVAISSICGVSNSIDVGIFPAVVKC
jgi:hypothetical protein